MNSPTPTTPKDPNLVNLVAFWIDSQPELGNYFWIFQSDPLNHGTVLFRCCSFDVMSITHTEVHDNIYQTNIYQASDPEFFETLKTTLIKDIMYHRSQYRSHFDIVTKRPVEIYIEFPQMD